jgi:hypothetical protein
MKKTLDIKSRCARMIILKNGGDEMAVHFVGFRGDRFQAAVRVFGYPISFIMSGIAARLKSLIQTKTFMFSRMATRHKISSSHITILLIGEIMTMFADFTKDVENTFLDEIKDINKKLINAINAGDNISEIASLKIRAEQTSYMLYEFCVVAARFRLKDKNDEV